ncbi:Ribosomal protein L11 methyltransferase [Lentibacillus sp. JNUCC-1]|uniref:50S ribosomal protein L11 methyltransferase n=1 Tax=Lentibacillus sp. JNUCC-1 TaxID=2654513 RepID=UPI0012E97C28|nr:50S ribosomal protein L11 methyltransferase [Lentibacillus sp. JNUCC-1]MUV39588.1 Ribosomal protein L11 methyltransferase [Lentibacillus sp. JNUCC-1]
MKWNEVAVNTNREAVEAVSHTFHEIGASGVSIEDPLDMIKDRDSLFGEIYELNPGDYPEKGVNVKAYFPEDFDLKTATQQLNTSLQNLKAFFDIGNGSITIKEMDETDWATAWKAYYKPVKVSDKIVIVPTWETYIPEEGEIILELDPGMAFGTGTHPTTQLCIRMLESYVEQGQKVIDVGCGSGVLSIASVLLGAGSVHALDLDDVAVSSTRNNLDLNGFLDHVRVEQGNLLEKTHLCADIIVSNILAEVIVQFTDDAWDKLETDGLFIVSGIIMEKKAMVIDALTVAGFVIKEVAEMEDWVSICAQKKQV